MCQCLVCFPDSVVTSSLEHLLVSSNSVRSDGSLVLPDSKKTDLPCQQRLGAAPNRQASRGWSGAMQPSVSHAMLPELQPPLNGALFYLRGRSDVLVLRRTYHEHIDMPGWKV